MPCICIVANRNLFTGDRVHFKVVPLLGKNNFTNSTKKKEKVTAEENK